MNSQMMGLVHDIHVCKRKPKVSSAANGEPDAVQEFLDNCLELLSFLGLNLIGFVRAVKGNGESSSSAIFVAALL